MVVGGERHASASLTPGERDPLPILQEAERASGPVWTGVENFTSTGIRYPYRPSRSKSLYRLSYPFQIHKAKQYLVILK